MFIINQLENRGQHKAVVNKEMKIQIPRKAVNFAVGKYLQLLKEDSEDVVCSR